MNREIIIDYTNYKGVRSKRKIMPYEILFDYTEFHPEFQWLLAAYDLEKEKSRLFAMKDIHSWETIK